MNLISKTVYDHQTLKVISQNRLFFVMNINKTKLCWNNYSLCTILLATSLFIACAIGGYMPKYLNIYLLQFGLHEPPACSVLGGVV